MFNKLINKISKFVKKLKKFLVNLFKEKLDVEIK